MVDEVLIPGRRAQHKAASAPRASQPQASASRHVGLVTGIKLPPQAIEVERVFGGETRQVAMAHRRLHAKFRAHDAQETPIESPVSECPHCR